MELDNVHEGLGMIIQCKNGIITKLKKENEELKAKLESYNCSANCYKYKEANKYKQALEEIREIAGDAIDELLNYVGRIYNKIDEVLKDQ